MVPQGRWCASGTTAGDHGLNRCHDAKAQPRPRPAPPSPPAAHPGRWGLRPAGAAAPAGPTAPSCWRPRRPPRPTSHPATAPRRPRGGCEVPPPGCAVGRGGATSPCGVRSRPGVTSPCGVRSRPGATSPCGVRSRPGVTPAACAVGHPAACAVGRSRPGRARDGARPGATSPPGELTSPPPARADRRHPHTTLPSSPRRGARRSRRGPRPPTETRKRQLHPTRATSQTFLALAGRPWRDETRHDRARVTDLSSAVRIPDSRGLRPVLPAPEMNLVGVSLAL